MRVQVTGQKDLYRLAHNLHEAGQKSLKRELDRGSRAAGKVLEDEVKDSTKTYIPQNFERRFDLALATKTEVRLVQSRRITVVFWAMGKTVRRDIEAMNAGELRHPVFGRMRRLKAGGRYTHESRRKWIEGTHYRNPWVEQKIKPGLVTEPATRAMPRAVKKIDDAVSRVVTEIERSG